MSEWYFASLLVMTGVCLAFALHAGNLAIATRSRQYVQLLLLAVIEGVYCALTFAYFRETSGDGALVFGQAICVVTPFITYIFGELVIEVASQAPRWLVVGQRVNLGLTSLFVAMVMSDAVLHTQLVLGDRVQTDLASAHRHLLLFRPLGFAYLAWVSCAFAGFAWLLFSLPTKRREVLPMIVGCVIYFVATMFDFGVLVRFHDAHFIQHYGFFALVFASWLVLARRFEDLLIAQRDAVDRLEAERRKLLTAAPVLHKQKLESLGTLAAGVAHEINNPIHGILNYASLLRRGVPGDETASFLDEIQGEAQRVASIVRNLLRFGRAEDGAAVATRPRDVVEDTMTLVRSVFLKDAIEVDVALEDGAPELVCRVQQLQQVLMNLMMNARDALQARDPSRSEPKRIVLRAGGIARGEDGWIYFEVTDNADGFDASVAERVFDPFFTTKTSIDQVGLGLGLSISHGIVVAHGGTLTCKSAPNEGTTFRMEVPCVHPTEAAARDSELQRIA